MTIDYQDSFQVYENKPDHHFRTEIPNIVYELGLDPYACHLYGLLKRIAGDSGACWSSKAYLSEKSLMGLTKIRDCLEQLSKPFELLQNKSLIRITKRSSADGSSLPDLIVIEPIWSSNGQYFRSLSKLKKDLEASRGEGGGLRVAKGEGSRGEPKEEPIKKNPIKEEQQQAAKDSLSSVVVSSKNEAKRKIFDKYGLSEMTISKLMRFSLEDLQSSLLAYEQWIRKNGPPDDPNPAIYAFVSKGHKPNLRKKDSSEEEKKKMEKEQEKNYLECKKLEKLYEEKMSSEFKFSVFSNYISISHGRKTGSVLELKDPMCVEKLKMFINKRL